MDSRTGTVAMRRFKSSPPKSHAGCDLGIADPLAGGTPTVGSVSQDALPAETNIGRKLAAELVAQAQAEFNVDRGSAPTFRFASASLPRLNSTSGVRISRFVNSTS